MLRFVQILLCSCIFARPAEAMEPLAMMASQPAWQAGVPVEVNVDYSGADILAYAAARGAFVFVATVPAYGAADEEGALRKASMHEHSVEERCEGACLHI